MSNKLKIAFRYVNQSLLLVLIPFLGSITEDFSNFLRNIFANINNSDFCKFQPLFRYLFIANIKLALICERRYNVLDIILVSWNKHK